MAQDHTAQGNRLINVARRMIAGNKMGTCEVKKKINNSTMRPPSEHMRNAVEDMHGKSASMGSKPST